MMKNTINVFIVNLTIGIIAVLILIMIAIKMGLASHDTHLTAFEAIFVLFSLVHLATNVGILYVVRKVKKTIIIYSSVEIIVLYGLAFRFII